jgi:hypothetical protein
MFLDGRGADVIGAKLIRAIRLPLYGYEEESMPRKLRLVKGAAQRAALVYGMRMFGPRDVAAVEDAQVRLNDGSSGRVTMHFIEGTRAQIRRQLLQSVDAFFELLGEDEQDR